MPELPQCVHHWIINPRNMGRCIKCGKTKDYGQLNDKWLTKRLKVLEAAMAGGRASKREKKGRPVVEI